MIPFTPHLAHECLEQLNCKTAWSSDGLKNQNNIVYEKVLAAINHGSSAAQWRGRQGGLGREVAAPEYASQRNKKLIAISAG